MTGRSNMATAQHMKMKSLNDQLDANVRENIENLGKQAPGLLAEMDFVFHRVWEEMHEGNSAKAIISLGQALRDSESTSGADMVVSLLISKWIACMDRMIDNDPDAPERMAEETPADQSMSDMAWAPVLCKKCKKKVGK